MKFGLEDSTGKALSVWLEFIDETGEKGFCLQMQIKSFVPPAPECLEDIFALRMKGKWIKF